MQESKLVEQTAKDSFLSPAMLKKLEAYRELLSYWARAGLQFDVVIANVGREYVQTAVRTCHGNHSKAAKLIGVHRNTIARHAGKEVEG